MENREYSIYEVGILEGNDKEKQFILFYVQREKNVKSFLQREPWENGGLPIFLL